MKCGKDALHVNRVHGNGKHVKGNEGDECRSSKSHAPANNHAPILSFRISGRKERNAMFASKQTASEDGAMRPLRENCYRSPANHEFVLRNDDCKARTQRMLNALPSYGAFQQSGRASACRSRKRDGAAATRKGVLLSAPAGSKRTLQPAAREYARELCPHHSHCHCSSGQEAWVPVHAESGAN